MMGLFQEVTQEAEALSEKGRHLALSLLLLAPAMESRKEPSSRPYLSALGITLKGCGWGGKF